jgi:hypothetical protein
LLAPRGRPSCPGYPSRCRRSRRSRPAACFASGAHHVGGARLRVRVFAGRRERDDHAERRPAPSSPVLATGIPDVGGHAFRRIAAGMGCPTQVRHAGLRPHPHSATPARRQRPLCRFRRAKQTDGFRPDRDLGAGPPQCRMGVEKSKSARPPAHDRFAPKADAGSLPKSGPPASRPSSHALNALPSSRRSFRCAPRRPSDGSLLGQITFKCGQAGTRNQTRY